jgi:hypothetical protein
LCSITRQFELNLPLDRRPPAERKRWRETHPDQDIGDGHVFTQPWPATRRRRPRGRRAKVIYYQYRADRARRTLRGIDEQVAKAEEALAGKEPVKRNWFIKVTGATKSVNRDLETKAAAWPD